jgi:hypothetical protein
MIVRRLTNKRIRFPRGAESQGNMSTRLGSHRLCLFLSPW